MVCLPTAAWVELLVSAANGWPHDMLRHQSAVGCYMDFCRVSACYAYAKRDIVMTNPSVRHTLVLYRNECTYRGTLSTIWQGHD